MSETLPTTLDRDKILSTQKRRLLYNEIRQGKSIKEAAPLAGLGINYAQNLVAKCGMNELIKRETAEISAKIGITVESEQLALAEDIVRAREAGCWGAVMSGHTTLLRSIGGMTGDRPHPDALASKRLDAKQREFLQAVAEKVYSERYLAISGAHSSMSAQSQEKEGVKQVESECKDNGLQLVSGGFASCFEAQGEAENSQEAPPMPPQAPVAESTTPPVYNAEVF